jgi:hypothetical protein
MPKPEGKTVRTRLNKPIRVGGSPDDDWLAKWDMDRDTYPTQHPTPAVRVVMDGRYRNGAAWTLGVLDYGSLGQFAVNTLTGVDGHLINVRRVAWSLDYSAFAAKLDSHEATAPGNANEGLHDRMVTLMERTMRSACPTLMALLDSHCPDVPWVRELRATLRTEFIYLDGVPWESIHSGYHVNEWIDFGPEGSPERN